MFKIQEHFENKNIGIAITPIMMDGEPIFLCNEIGPQLGYSDISKSIRNSQGFIKDIDYKIVSNGNLKELKELLRRDSNTTPVLLANINALIVLTESGLYTVAIKSTKSYAIQFRVWITSVVLPKIRATGSFHSGDNCTSLAPVSFDNNETDQFVLQFQQNALIMAKMLEFRHEQRMQIEKQLNVEQKVKKIEKTLANLHVPQGYNTIIGYSTLNAYRLKPGESIKLGKKASKLSRNLRVEIKKARDARFTTVNSYSNKVLEFVFRDIVDRTTMEKAISNDKLYFGTK